MAPQAFQSPPINLRTSFFTKAVSILGIFIIFISYQYWSHLVKIPTFIHRKVPSTDFQFDNPTGHNWTQRIWQTSKNAMVTISGGDREHLKTWSDLNPEYRHEVLTDEMMESYVKDHFHVSHPDIEDVYFEVKDYILRSDFIRYLILLADGGVYNDLDVACLKSINTWVPQQYENTAGILLGVEIDNDYGPDGRTPGGQDLFQLVNWTIMSKPNQPFMWFLVKRVMENIRSLAASQNRSISEMTYTITDVLDVTGPAALTTAFFDYASSITGSNVTYHNLTKMTQPRLIGEVVILPINSFGAGHQVEWAGFKQDGTALIHHYFAGSWKTDHFDAPPPPPVDEEQKQKEDEKKKQEEADKAAEEEKKKEETKKKMEGFKKTMDEQKEQVQVNGNSTDAKDTSVGGNLNKTAVTDTSTTQTSNENAIKNSPTNTEQSGDKPASVQFF
ncbi:hypothetical protein MMC28_008032 [Mycoblastus sanguinarius]|nr:hypothetical protein [Mycoblastus sanguinarius]